jgi:AraC family transcriptional regulator
MPLPVRQSSMPHTSLEQWHSGTRLQNLTTSDSLDWNNARLEIAQHDAMPELAYSPYLEDDVFAFLLAGTALMKMRIPDGIAQNERVNPGSLQLLPRQTVFGATWNAAWTYGALQLNRGMMIAASAALHSGDPEKTELVPTYGFTDPLLYHLGVELSNELQSANLLGVLYAESLTNTLILYLLRHYSTGRVVRELSSSHLTPAQLRGVDEFIHAHLDQRISLADLANCVHLSVPHFARMFRTTTHRPPYQYVLELRLERARILLETTRLPLAEVAYRCGFSSQSHFTTHFTRYVGVSPARFARGTRP